MPQTRTHMGWLQKIGLLFVAWFGLYGCSDNTTVVSDGRGGGLVTILNDSLAILTDTRGKEVCKDHAITGVTCTQYSDNTGLFLVNYRHKAAPLWGDTLDYYLQVLRGHLKDSTVLVTNSVASEFGFWKVGEKPEKLKLWDKPDECVVNVTTQVRPWKKGGVLMRNDYNHECPYMLLDTSTGQVTSFSFSGEDAWLSECEEFNYNEGNVYCIKKRQGIDGFLELLVNGSVVNAVQLDSCELLKVYQWYGAYLLLDLYCPHYYNVNSSRDWRANLFEIRKIDFYDFSFDTSYPDLWLSVGSKFMQNESTYVQYYPEDRMVTKEGL